MTQPSSGPTPSPPELAIRDATVDDLPAIVRLLADDILGATRELPQEPLVPAYRDAFAAIEAQSGNRLLVADLDGAVVGCLQLVILPGLGRVGTLRAQIESVRVDRAVRGRRIGEMLVTHAVAAAGASGCGLVQLTTDRARTDAHRFYERLGFEATHIGMKRNLHPLDPARDS